MPDLIQQCIASYGPAPRSFSLWASLTYMRIPKPLWLSKRPDDKINVIFKNAKTLFAEGLITWGHVVQANQLMFKPGGFNCPGEVVYSLADPQQATPNYLSRVAMKLYSLKGSTPANPALAGIANYLTDEMIRVFGLKVPTAVSPSVPCQVSTTFFIRKHLSRRLLASPLLPILVNRTEPRVVMPLPSRYWPSELIQQWSK